MPETRSQKRARELQTLESTGSLLSRPHKRPSLDAAHVKAPTIASCVDNSDREIGRIRYYDSAIGDYGPWMVMRRNQVKENWSISLSRGGSIKFFPDFLGPDRRSSISSAVETFSYKFRSYLFRSIFKEPRIHFLLSFDDSEDGPRPGYKYHGVKMKSTPIKHIPAINELAIEYAQYFKVPNNKWNIGVDVIVYRDGKDQISWHADDSQGEAIILCVVIDSPEKPRRLKIRPKGGRRHVQNGDEEVELFVAAGDAYVMDGIMQRGYEHSLPQQTGCHLEKRTALVFRHGREVLVESDSGALVETTAPPDRTIEYYFGPMREHLKEGSIYSRREMLNLGVHRADRKGISGNKQVGCDAIVVARQDPGLGELDNLSFLKYSASSRVGGSSLFTSWKKAKPIRVFRSSKLINSSFGVPPPKKKSASAEYRFDGIYFVSDVWDDTGAPVSESFPKGKKNCTFLLCRFQPSPDGNLLSTKALVETSCQNGTMLPISSTIDLPDPPISMKHHNKVKDTKLTGLCRDFLNASKTLLLGSMKRVKDLSIPRVPSFRSYFAADEEKQD